MKIEEARKALLESFAKCATPDCGELIDEWPEANTGEGPLEYVPRLALFAGMCGKGHVNEAYLAEVKAGELAFHDVSERTLGRYVSQEDCTHGKRDKGEVPEGTTIATMEGYVRGPAKFVMCQYCCARWASKASLDCG